MTSCGKKPIATDTTETNARVEEKLKQTIREFSEKSLAINDNFKIEFPTIRTGATKVQDCDSLCNEKIKEKLKSINIEKQSGNNGYKFAYDEFTKQLSITINQGETINLQRDSITELNKIIENSSKQVKTIPVKYVPKWIQYLAGFGALALLYLLIRLSLFIRSKIPA